MFNLKNKWVFASEDERNRFIEERGIFIGSKIKSSDIKFVERGARKTPYDAFSSCDTSLLFTVNQYSPIGEKGYVSVIVEACDVTEELSLFTKWCYWNIFEIVFATKNKKDFRNILHDTNNVLGNKQGMFSAYRMHIILMKLINKVYKRNIIKRNIWKYIIKHKFNTLIKRKFT